MTGILDSTALDSVKLDVEAFIGATEISVGELQNLTADSILTLQSPLDQLVELRLNGVTIGKGELVAVGDNFAVRISELAE